MIRKFAGVLRVRAAPHGAQRSAGGIASLRAPDTRGSRYRNSWRQTNPISCTAAMATASCPPTHWRGHESSKWQRSAEQAPVPMAVAPGGPTTSAILNRVRTAAMEAAVGLHCDAFNPLAGWRVQSSDHIQTATSRLGQFKPLPATVPRRRHRPSRKPTAPVPAGRDFRTALSTEPIRCCL